MAKNLIGHMTCPECGYKDAEVALDKGGKPYRVCLGEECDGIQHFTRGKPGAMKNLLARTRPVAGFDLPALAEKLGVKLPAPAGGGEPPKPAPAAPVKKSGIQLF